MATSMGAVTGVARKPASDAVYDAVMMSVWKQSPSSPSLIRRRRHLLKCHGRFSFYFRFYV